MKKHLLLVLCTYLSLTAISQQLWTEESPASQGDYLSRNSASLPATARFFRLDVATLRQHMQSARSYDPARPNASTASLVLPLPDGSLLPALVYESSVLSPQLQAQLPNVHTYILVDPGSYSSLGRITIHDDNITGLIFSRQGTVYLNPVAAGSSKVHVSYFTREVKSPFPVVCGTTDAGDPLARGNAAARVYAGDCQLRTYKLAVAATGEYYTWAGSTKAAALTYITITVNSIDAVYERDATIHFNLVSDSAVIYTNAATDPYSTVTFPSGTTLNQNNSAIDGVLGSGAYDVGIVFNNGWNGGLAQLSSVCTVSHGRAAAGLTFGTGANPTAGPQGPVFEGTVAHEIAHQFSATHTMIANNGSCAGNVTAATAYEPGGGSTLMAYAGSCTGNSYQTNSDLYFHAGSVAQIASYATSGTGNSCPVKTSSGNTAPTVTVAAASYTIPVSTPFMLTAAGADAEGNDLTYTWEQMDAAAEVSTPPSATSTTGPNFRSYPQSATATRYFPNMSAVLAGTTPTYEVLPSVTRTMNFRVNVRDNAANGGCNVQADVAVNTNVAAGPFTVTSQSSATSLTADGVSTFTVTWNVAGTSGAPVSCSNVDILFSADGGANFNYTLLSNTPNDGTQTLTIPNIVTSAGRIMVKAVGNIFFNVNAANITIASGCGAEGATLSPSSTVNAGAGNAILNLSSAPQYGSVVSPAGTLQSSDPSANLAVYSSVTTACQQFGNVFRYHTYTFQVNLPGTYTFTKSAGTYIVDLYTGAYSSGSPCTNFLASNGTYNGTSVSIGSSVSASLLPGVQYTLTVGSFSSSQPTLPFAYTITVTGPVGGNIYSGYPNPGASFTYAYVIVNNATGNIVAISSSPDLRNTSTFPVGTYTVYGFSYLTANFNAGALSAYVGGSLATLSNDLLNNPGAKCGNLSKNNVAVNILSTLPVKLLPLTALWENGAVRLYWSTAQEVGSKEFVIERSGDGVQFEPIQVVAASLNSDVRTNYNTLDAHPLTGRNFYRIKALDLDDAVTYSNIAQVKSSDGRFQLKMYPNPTAGSTTLEVLADRNGSATVELISVNGTRLSASRISLKKGVNIATVATEHLPAGIYYVRVMAETQVMAEKLIKF